MFAYLLAFGIVLWWMLMGLWKVLKVVLKIAIIGAVVWCVGFGIVYFVKHLPQEDGTYSRYHNQLPRERY